MSSENRYMPRFLPQNSHANRCQNFQAEEMEKEQDNVGPETTCPTQEPTSIAVEEYLRLADRSSHLVSRFKNNVALFQDVSVWGVDAGMTYQNTIASHLLSPARLVYALLSQKKSTRKVILHGINGIVREGEMLLLLGRPGSGCTTLLKTLAGLTESFHGWSGAIKYLGVTIDSIKKSYRGDIVYNAEGTFSACCSALIIRI